MDDPGSILASLSSTNPQLDSGVWLQIVAFVLALLLCGLASATEAALTSISRIKLKNLIGEGDTQATEIEQLLSKPNKYFTTILVINTLAIVVVVSVVTTLAVQITGSQGEFLSLLLLSLIVLIFCELLPRTLAVQNPLRWARLSLGPVRVATWLLQPIVWLLSSINELFIRPFRRHLRHAGPFVTEEEQRLLVSVDEEDGELEEDETEMIQSIFDFADKTVREVMIPRIDMVTLEGSSTVDDSVDLALQGGFSRIPVYEENIDNIIGVLYVKDMLRQLRLGNGQLPIRTMLRHASFVPEAKKLDDLLQEIRRTKVHIVMVVDEYGSISGLVTIEDLVEEIIGDIQDEYDHEEKLFEQIGEYEYLVDAKIGIDEFNDLMKTNLDDDNYETLGGFLYAQLDKIPTIGDTIATEGMNFTVLTTRGRRITKVRVQVEPPQTPIEPEEQTDQQVVILPEPELQSATGEGESLPTVKTLFSRLQRRSAPSLPVVQPINNGGGISLF